MKKTATWAAAMAWADYGQLQKCVGPGAQDSLIR